MTTCNCCSNSVQQTALSCHGCECAWCYICVQQLHQRITDCGITTYPWLKWTAIALSEVSPAHPLSVPPEESPCCFLKESGYLDPPPKRSQIMKLTHDERKSLKIHDGVMILPEYQIAVAPSFKHVDIISMCKQKMAKEHGPLHGVIDPLMAAHFACQRSEPLQDISQFKHTYEHVCLEESQKVLVKLSFISVSRSSSSPEKGGTMEDDEQWKSCTLFMTEQQMQKEHEHGVDLWILLGEPRSRSSKADYHILTARWLGRKIPELCHDSIYQFLKGHPNYKSRNGIQVDRCNGANGNIRTYDRTSLKKFMLIKNKCPGETKAAVIIPSEMGLKVFWKKEEEENVKKKKKKKNKSAIGNYTYPFPLGGFQVSMEKGWLEKESATSLLDLMMEQAKAKLFVHKVVQEMNCQRSANYERLIVSQAVKNQEDIYKQIRNAMKHPKKGLGEDADNEYLFLLISIAVCKISVITGALRYHEDVASRSDDSKYHCFWEPKTLIKIPSLSGKDGTTSLPLGRGGAGIGNFVMAIVDHSFSREALDWIIDQIRRGRAPDRPLNGFLLVLRRLRQQQRQQEEERRQGQCSGPNHRQAPELPENLREAWGSLARQYLNNLSRNQRRRSRILHQ